MKWINMEEDNLFDLLREKDDYNNLLYYIGDSRKQIGDSVNKMIEQNNIKINEITAKILANS